MWEVNIDYFNTYERFLILRNYLSLRFINYGGVGKVNLTHKLKIINDWINEFKDDFEGELPTAIDLYQNPITSRKNDCMRDNNEISNEEDRYCLRKREVKIDLKNEKDTPRWKKRRIHLKNRVKEIKSEVYNSEFKDFPNLLKMKKKRIEKSNWLNYSSSKRHRTKDENLKFLYQENYKIRKDFNQCLLAALRFLTGGFPLNIFTNAFDSIDPTPQIKIADKCLQEFYKKIDSVGNFTGTFKSLRKMLYGKNLVVFQTKYGNHIEAVMDFKSPPDIESWVEELSSEVNNFELYKIVDIDE